jgi:hypothetical protein
LGPEFSEPTKEVLRTLQNDKIHNVFNVLMLTAKFSEPGDKVLRTRRQSSENLGPKF